MQTYLESTALPNALIGSFRRFGAYGPAYEIVGLDASEKDANKILLNVRVLDSGENIRYPYRDALKDPEA